MRKPTNPKPHSMHIVLPRPLYEQLRERATEECESMRRIVLEGIRKRLAQPREEATR